MDYITMNYITYTTARGHCLHLMPIPRARIDAFSAVNPPPDAPMREVMTWGDVPEEVPNTDDPEYQAALGRYHLDLGKQHVALIADGVILIDDVDLSELDELASLGVDEMPNTIAGFLRYMVDDDEAQEIVANVLYLSTVTDRGLWEASQRYNVRWGGGPLTAFVVLGKSSGSYGGEFEARRAAQFNLVKWSVFCEMSGAEQSSVVAFYRLSNSLAWLQSKEANKK